MNITSIAKLALFLVTFSSFSFAQQKALTADDYARAEKMLIFNTSPLVDRGGVNPHFLPDGTFWYRVLTPSGSEYVLINPINGARKVAAKQSELGVTPPLPKNQGEANAVDSPDGKRS